uniref:Uncharacterized protein n=1 Tax=Compsopogon caeruleus TaxID=31354 RepID=A0A7S1XAB6_9RHOD|mmetsp:Transcript_10114/g.20451  ORF Transcript_10114/g.20451 Transcript_10114/m.20451 type:complete len:166 (+) Transcript_10114:151-648(+)
MESGCGEDWIPRMTEHDLEWWEMDGGVGDEGLWEMDRSVVDEGLWDWDGEVYTNEGVRLEKDVGAGGLKGESRTGENGETSGDAKVPRNHVLCHSPRVRQRTRTETHRPRRRGCVRTSRSRRGIQPLETPQIQVCSSQGERNNHPRNEEGNSDSHPVFEQESKQR